MNNIYIHIPFCLKKCLYCSFAVHAVGTTPDNKAHMKHTLEKQYLNTLIREMEQQFTLLPPAESLSTLYFGGGTPSLLSEEGYQVIMSTIERWFPRKSPHYECTVECDPGTFDLPKLNFLGDVGVNRISLGVQSFTDSILHKLNRSHTLEQTYLAIENLKSSTHFADLRRVSMDLLISTPHSTSIHIH